MDFDGTKVIPIVRMGFAVSAGPHRGQQNDDDDDDNGHGQEQGHGEGAGIHVRSMLAPQALLIVTKAGDVRVIGLPGGRPWRERAERGERPEGAQEPAPAPRQ